MTDPIIRPLLWWLCLAAAPLVLIAVELFHPAGFTQTPGMYQYLSQAEGHQAGHYALDYFGPNWWFTLHMIQTPMVALVSVGLWLLTASVTRADGRPPWLLAWVSRAAVLVFLIYYIVLDGIGGIGLGRTIVLAQDLAAQGKLDASQMDGIRLLLNTAWTDPWIGGVGSMVSQTGSWAVFIAAVAAAGALGLARKFPWPPLVILVAFGWELQTSHASPHGPIAFGLLLVAAISLWFARRSNVT